MAATCKMCLKMPGLRIVPINIDENQMKNPIQSATSVYRCMIVVNSLLLVQPSCPTPEKQVHRYKFVFSTKVNETKVKLRNEHTESRK